MEEQKTLSDIVDQLVANTYQILDWKFRYATIYKVITDPAQFTEIGLPEGYSQFDHGKLDEIVQMTQPLLKDAQATRKIEAQSSNHIIKLIGTGKISIEDAMRLMSMMKVKLEVEEKEAQLKIKKDMLKLLEKTDG